MDGVIQKGSPLLCIMQTFQKDSFHVTGGIDCTLCSIFVANLLNMWTFSISFFADGTVSCGGLQTAIFTDYQSPVAKVEIQVLGLLGKLLSGPWMSRFYTSVDTQVSHIDGICIVKGVLTTVKAFGKKTQRHSFHKDRLFGKELAGDDQALMKLQQKPVDEPVCLHDGKVPVCHYCSP